MKKLKIKVETVKVKSFVTSSRNGLKSKAKLNDGGYTWVG